MVNIGTITGTIRNGQSSEILFQEKAKRWSNPPFLFINSKQIYKILKLFIRTDHQGGLIFSKDLQCLCIDKYLNNQIMPVNSYVVHRNRILNRFKMSENRYRSIEKIADIPFNLFDHIMPFLNSQLTG